MPKTTRGNLNLYWTERGDPDGKPLVLLHGLLLSSRMFERLSAFFPDRRVLMVDLHGHGKSSKPIEPESYYWSEMTADVVAVLDAAGIDQAVVGGTSLGADVTLFLGAQHPERTSGLIAEMPVLWDSEPFAKRVFGPAASVLHYGAPLLAPLTRAISRLPLPRRPPELAMFRDAASLEPRAAAAMLRGLLSSDRPEDDEVHDLTVPTLVIGHESDRLHALTDARRLVEVLPKAELHETRSFFDFRFSPAGLATVISGWLSRNDL
jgi:pimeloyl-ACP methyl ester carboxylesterase